MKTSFMELVKQGILTKIGRLGMVTMTLIFFLTITVLDGNVGEFTVRAAYLPILESILVTMIIALFTAKSGENIMKTIHDNKLKGIEENRKTREIEFKQTKLNSENNSENNSDLEDSIYNDEYRQQNK